MNGERERRYRIVQPWGRDVGRESTLVSEHATVAEAFIALDALTAQMIRTGANQASVTLLVVNDAGNVVRRPGVH
jgi:hypothetical protein